MRLARTRRAVFLGLLAAGCDSASEGASVSSNPEVATTSSKPEVATSQTIEVPDARGSTTAPKQTKEALRAQFGSHQNLSYLEARKHLFGTIDNQGGKVIGVYTGLEVATSKIPNPNVMNTEHSWPRSRLPEAALSDLHHLFPTKASANKKRSNVYFGNVVSVDWEEGGSKFADNKNNKKAFEVRREQRGDTARAMFYVSTIYDLSIPPWEEEFLRIWNTEDPVDARERARNGAIEKVQGNRNPFVDHPEFVEMISDF